MLTNFQTLISKHNLKINGVLHIGAHEGAEMLDYAQAGIPYAILVEANPTRFQNLQKSIEEKRYPTWCSPLTYAYLPEDIKNNTEFYAYNYAITNEVGLIDLNLSTHDGGMDSIYKINAHGTNTSWAPYQHTNLIQVPSTTLDLLIVSHNTVHRKHFRPNFLNIDIEGAELEALKGADFVLSYTDYILVETQDTPRFEGSCVKQELSTFLLQYGFKEADYFGTKYDWGDTFYVKG